MLDDDLESPGRAGEPLAEIVAAGFERATGGARRTHAQLAEYKRRQAAPGVKVTLKNFGRDRRYPITNKFREKL